MSVVEEIRDRVDKRLAELQGAVDEYRELLAIKQGLEDPERQAPDALEAPSAARSSTSRRSRTSGRRRGSGARRGGTRAEQAISIVGAKPGVTVNEIAANMGINQNYLYRLLPRMEREGRLRREGRGWALPSD